MGWWYVTTVTIVGVKFLFPAAFYFETNMWRIYEAYIKFVNINNLSIFTRIANRIANSKDIKCNSKANIYVKQKQVFYAKYLKLGL